MNQLTFFFMAYTALVILSSLTMIYSSALHLSSYYRMRGAVLHYISARAKAEGKALTGAVARLNEGVEKLTVSFTDVSADEEVFFRSGGSRADFRSINRTAQRGFNRRVLPLVTQQTRTAHDLTRLQKQLLRAAQLEALTTLKDLRVQKFLVSYFVRLLDVLGRASAAGFILSSLIIVGLVSRTQVFDTYGGISLATSFIFSAVFGTYFVSIHYARRRALNTGLFVLIALVLSGLLTARVFS